MCGIVGAIDLRGRREFPSTCLNAMSRAVAHRGPDAEGSHLAPGIALASRRLAIRDIPHGTQPCSNNNHSIWSVFNGEIYNDVSLRHELLAQNYSLLTHCDAELWIPLYEESATDMLSRVKGQFAVALWDSNQRRLLLARDRMGICPLYYAIRDGWLIFASEIKALFASGLVHPEPDPRGIDYFFNFLCASTTRTCFKDIHVVPPGHYLVATQQHVTLHQYWDLDFPNNGYEREVSNENVLIEEFEALLKEAIHSRLNCDVNVASYLSGGLDSSVILGLANQIQGHPLPAFTIGLNKNTGPDERLHSNAAAKEFGSPLTTVNIDATEIIESFPEMILAAEGPVLDTSCAALMRLANVVHNEGFKVALTGEGADEALAGYPWFKTQKLTNYASRWLGPNLPLITRKILQMAVTNKNKLITSTPFYGMQGIRPAQQFMYEAVALTRHSFYSSAMCEAIRMHDAYADLHLPNPRIKEWHPLNQSLYVGYKIMLAGLLMVAKGDRIAMHSSLEMRYPFLDEDIIDFCASISPRYKLNGMTDKWLLRQVAKKNLSAAIAKRHKTIFRANLFSLFLNKNRPAWVDQLLSEESLNKTGYFNAKAVMHERAQQMRWPLITPHQLCYDAALTCVLSTQLWHHLFCGGGLCELSTWSNNDTP